MKKIISALLVVTALLQLIPAMGFISGEHLSAMYGIAFQEVNLLILMRHRAVLYLLITALLLYGAFNRAIQPLAFIAGIVSSGSFILFALLLRTYNAPINKMLAIDAIELICLIIATLLYLIGHYRSDQR